MFEPHLGFNDPNTQDMKSFNDDTTFGGNGSNLLAELDKMAPIKAFDAFPKVSTELLVFNREGYHVGS